MKAHSIYFVKGRLKFGNGENSAPFPSAVIIFKKDNALKEMPRLEVLTVK
jgi:site-specific DNA-methyltransferase (adenine-specific)